MQLNEQTLHCRVSARALWRSWMTFCPDFTLQMMMRSVAWKPGHC